MAKKFRGHCAREESIALLGDENKRADKPEFEIITGGDSALTRIHGRFDIDSSPALRDRLLALFEAQHAKVASIDLSAVTHLDSSRVATLIEALRIARRHKTDVRLQGLEGRLLQLFQSTGILSLFSESTRANTRRGSKAV